MDSHNAVPDGLREIVKSYEHVSVAVEDFTNMAPLLALIGAEEIDGGHASRAEFDWIQYRMPGGAVLELIRTTSTASDHFITRFIAERGEGLHHITFMVADIDEARRASIDAGFRVVGYDDADPTWQELFLHPETTHGVLIQLAASSEPS